MDLQHLFRPASQPNRGGTAALVLLHGMGGHETDLMTLGSMLEPHCAALCRTERSRPTVHVRRWVQLVQGSIRARAND